MLSRRGLLEVQRRLGVVLLTNKRRAQAAKIKELMRAMTDFRQ